MSRVRRAANVVGAVILTVTTAMPVAAEDPVVTGGEFATHDPRVTFYSDEAGLHVIGQYELEGASRRLQDPRIILSFRDAAGASVHVVGTPMMLTTVINYTEIPWHVVIAEEDVAGATTMEWWAAFSTSATLYPVGGLDVSPASLDGMTATGTVQNDSALTATDVVVYATLQSALNEEGGHWLDTAGSTPITLAPGETAGYTITFSPATSPGGVVEVVAQTTSGAHMTNWENHFSDIGTYWWRYWGSIIWLAREGIVTGCHGGNYCPKRSVTRGQMSTFLDRALDLPDTTVDYFTDDDGHWSEDSNNRIAEAGIAHGCGETTFCPTGRVNRGQMAKFLVRGYDLPPSSVDAFPDDETSTTEAYHDALFAAGVTFGCTIAPGGAYCPNSLVTREEMAAFIFRAEHLEP